MKTKAEQCKEEGNKCVKEGKVTEAVFHYTEAIKHNPNSAILYSNRSLSFLKIDQLFLAMEDAQKAIKLEPSWPKGFFRKGEIEMKAGSYNKAIMSYKQALLLDPTDDGITGAITKANKELSKDRKEATQKPIMYGCLGLAVGLLIVVGDQYVAKKPIIQYTILHILLIVVCGAIGYGIAKMQRFLTVSHRESLLDEPRDLLGEIDGTSSEEPAKEAPKPTHKHSSAAAARQRMKKGKL